MIMDRKQALLMKRMMQHYERPRVPNSVAEVEENYRAVRMVILIGCLDYAMMELKERLEERGQFVRLVKRNINNASRKVIDMHSDVLAIIRHGDKSAVRIFSEIRDANWWSIDEHVCFGDIDIAYSVVLALCRLIDACSKTISRRYHYEGIETLKYVSSMLSCVNAEDKHLDFVVDKSIVIK